MDIQVKKEYRVFTLLNRPNLYMNHPANLKIYNTNLICLNYQELSFTVARPTLIMEKLQKLKLNKIIRANC